MCRAPRSLSCGRSRRDGATGASCRLSEFGRTEFGFLLVIEHQFDPIAGAGLLRWSWGPQSQRRGSREFRKANHEARAGLLISRPSVGSRRASHTSPRATISGPGRRHWEIPATRGRLLQRRELLARLGPSGPGWCRAGEMMIFPFLTFTSTGSLTFAPISSRSGFGIITPWELPIFRMADFTVCSYVVITKLLQCMPYVKLCRASAALVSGA